MIANMNEIISKLNVKNDGNKSKNISMIKSKSSKENIIPNENKSYK